MINLWIKFIFRKQIFKSEIEFEISMNCFYKLNLKQKQKEEKTILRQRLKGCNVPILQV